MKRVLIGLVFGILLVVISLGFVIAEENITCTSNADCGRVSTSFPFCKNETHICTTTTTPTCKNASTNVSSCKNVKEDACWVCKDGCEKRACIEADVCDSDNLNLCLSETSCEGAGGKWENSTCVKKQDNEIEAQVCSAITNKILCEAKKNCQYNNVTEKCEKNEKEKEREKEHNKFKPWQKRNESECPEGCKCRGAVVTCWTEDGKIINITAGDSGKVITIIIDKIEVNTTLELETSTENNKTKLILNLPDGRNITLKVLPDRAVERVKEKLGEMNYTIELKEVTITKGNETRVVYYIVGEKHGRFLGLFKIRGKIITDVDAETGDVILIKKPWWGFLAGI